MKKLVNSIITICTVLALPSCQDDSAYQLQIRDEISNRIKYLQYNDESPFNRFDVPFQMPTYFSVDAEYRVNAKVERIEKRNYQIIGTSDEKTQRYLEFAWLHFKLKNRDHKLLVLKPIGLADVGFFYLAFADDTSGGLTYGGGRYLDISIGKSDKVVLDFNLAYNPYCAYVSDFSCPLPPSENILETAILAGEKDFKK
ncbi:MAG: DUF1684 domain-containing protein [Cyclobacteriaceae bacterium]|jgi:uncharacterized protein (DUF1684 family)